MVRLLPLLFLACATSTLTEYQQGAYRPSPPAFNPTTDAPHTVGQPGHIRAPQDYPRSPHKRPLPPTKEPGIWAADGTAKPIAVRLVLAGEPFAVLAYGEEDHSYLVAKSCEDSVNRVLASAPALNTAVRALSEAERRCFAATVYHECVSFRAASHSKTLGEMRSQGEKVGAEMRAISAGLSVAHVVSTTTVTDECGRGAYTARVEAAMRLWSRLAYTYPGTGQVH